MKWRLAVVLGISLAMAGSGYAAMAQDDESFTRAAPRSSELDNNSSPPPRKAPERTAPSSMDSISLSREAKKRAISLQSQGYLARAISEYKRAIKLNPEDAASYNNLGLAFTSLELFEDARDVLNKAIEMRPDAPNYHYNLGIVHLKLSDPARAEKEFRRVLELRKDDSETYFQLARVLLLQSEVEEAETAIRASLDIKPANAFASQLLGDILLRRARPDEAVLAYKRAQTILRRTDPQLQNKIEYTEALMQEKSPAASSSTSNETVVH